MIACSVFDYVRYKEDENGTKYPYIDVGSEYHGRRSFRLWISSKLITKDEDGNDIIRFPVRKANIIVTEKRNYVLKPDNEHMVYYVLVPCGYRGTSVIEIASPFVKAYKFSEYHSPAGRLGIDSGSLIVTKDGEPLRIIWRRYGRLYGSPGKGVTTIFPDGSCKTIDDIDDIDDIRSHLE